MPLILAVEPDRLQASHIVAVLRGRPRTELVIAESAAGALQAIAARVPDLVLTSPLLSRQDEADLAEWLRGLGPAAAHVQSLTIPILATAAPETTRGMLSVLLRRRPRKAGPTGCEPSMFASQVGLYLARTSREPVEEPWAAGPPEPPPDPAPEWPAAAIEPEPELAIAEIDTSVSNRIEAEIALASLRADEESRWVAGPLDEVREGPALVPEPALAEAVTDDAWMLTSGPAVDEPVAAAPEDSPDTAPLILLIPIYDLSPEPVVEAGVSALAAEVVTAPAIEPDFEPAIAEIDTAAYKRIEVMTALAALRADEESRWIVVPLDEGDEEPARWPEPAPVDPVTGNTWVLAPMPEVDELMAAAPADLSETAPLILLTTIYDLPPEPVVEAIAAAPAVDVEVPAPEVVAPAPEVVAAPAPVTTRRRKAGKPKAKPVQDEWGLFDPSQCGFAALLDKLDEITSQEAHGGKRDDVEVRVISY